MADYVAGSLVPLNASTSGQAAAHQRFAALTQRAQRSATGEASIAQIIAAAEQVFAEKGFHGAKMAEIAKLAGLPKANLHYYFGTKERLYRALLHDILHAWLAAAGWIVPERGPAEALAGYIRAKIDLSRERPAASRIFARELLNGAPYIQEFLRDELRRYVNDLGRVIEGWTRAKLMDPISPPHLLFTLWSMTQTYADFGVQIAAVLGRERVDDAVFETGAQTITAVVVKGCGIAMGH
jgi:TetR/AcrR family transcriptional regulator